MSGWCGYPFFHLLAIDFRGPGEQDTYVGLVVERAVLVLFPQPLSELQGKIDGKINSFSKHLLFSSVLYSGLVVSVQTAPRFPPLRTDLISLSRLEILELPLEAQVGAGAGPRDPHSGQCLLPAQPRHCHDVGDHQGDAAGHPGQTAGREGRRGSVRQGISLSRAQLSPKLCLDHYRAEIG